MNSDEQRTGQTGLDSANNRPKFRQTCETGQKWRNWLGSYHTAILSFDSSPSLLFPSLPLAGSSPAAQPLRVTPAAAAGFPPPAPRTPHARLPCLMRSKRNCAERRMGAKLKAEWAGDSVAQRRVGCGVSRNGTGWEAKGAGVARDGNGGEQRRDMKIIALVARVWRGSLKEKRRGACSNGLLLEGWRW